MCAGVVEYQSDAAVERGCWLSPVPCKIMKRTKRAQLNEVLGLASATTAEKSMQGFLA